MVLRLDGQSRTYTSDDWSLLWPLARYFEAVARCCFTNKPLQSLIIRQKHYQTTFASMMNEPPYQVLRVLVDERTTILTDHPIYQHTLRCSLECQPIF